MYNYTVVLQIVILIIRTVVGVMGSGGSKTPPSQQAVPDKDNSTDLSSTPTTAPKDTNVNSGGESTNQKSTADSRPTNQEKPVTPKQTESQGSTQSGSKKSEEKDRSISDHSTTNQTKEEEVKKAAVEPAASPVKEVETKQTDSTMPVSNL